MDRPTEPNISALIQLLERMGISQTPSPVAEPGRPAALDPLRRVVAHAANVGLRDSAFIKAMRRDKVCDVLFDALTATSLVRLGATNRQARAALSDYSLRTFNATKLFERFFKDPLAFRSLQARTHTLVSGSTALQFLDRIRYNNADLDLFVHPGEQGEVGHWLTAYEGYQWAPFPWQAPDFDNEVGVTWEPGDLNVNWPQFKSYRSKALSNVLVFKKGSEETGDLKKVELIVSKINPFHCILDFHSTCVMNFITWNAVFSLYPYATFEQRHSLRTKAKDDERIAGALAKYAARGYRIVPTVYPHEERSSAFFVGDTRWPGDAHCWTIRLNTAGVTRPGALSPASGPALTFNPVEQNSWAIDRVTQTARGVQKSTLALCYGPVTSPVFRFSYVIADPDHIKMIRSFTEAQEEVERMKCPEGCTRGYIWEHWTWWDSELPAMRRAYLAEVTGQWR